MKIKSLIVFAVMAVALMACSQKPVICPDCFAEKAGEMVGDTIDIEGTAVHICAHSGRKLFLQGADTTKFVLCLSDEVFTGDLLNCNVKVTGVVCESRITKEEVLGYIDAVRQAMEAEVAEGETEGEAHCGTEAKAAGIQGNSQLERFENMLTQIEEREAAEGKDYLSNYYITTISASLVK